MIICHEQENTNSKMPASNERVDRNIDNRTEW